MASVVAHAPPPLVCAACALSLARFAPASRLLGAYIQVRGKKKSAKGKTSIPVRLTEDLPGYGRKGSIVPMAIAPMRNFYFPQRIAEYLTFPEARELKRSGVEPERDFVFAKSSAEETDAKIKGIDRAEKKNLKQSAKAKPVRVKMDLLEPALAFDALKLLLPPTLTFYRAPILPAQPTTPQESLSTLQTSPIYGSVNLNDVATSVKALIASSSVAGRIVVNDEDIRFVHAGSLEDSHKEDPTRVKRLGDFDFEIRIKGHSEPIKSQIKILAEDDTSVGAAHGGGEEAKNLPEKSLAAGEASHGIL